MRTSVDYFMKTCLILYAYQNNVARSIASCLFPKPHSRDDNCGSVPITIFIPAGL